MAITVPSAQDVRTARARVKKTLDARLELLRTPVLAWIGVIDLAVHTLRELPHTLTRERLRAQADQATDTTRRAYDEWAQRGERRVERIRSQPRIARALRNAENLTDRANRQIDTIVDELHDAGVDLLGRVSTETRSAGEKTARRTQRAARELAANVAESGSEVAEEITEAGDEAAHETRSATRKAANRTAPASSTNARPATAR